jgi:hypothetical protein
VESYLQLARLASELQYRNPDHVLMFRGQSNDFKDQNGLTTLAPSIFRTGIEYPTVERFDRLVEAERRLVELYSGRSFSHPEKIRKYRILRWAILQHYEIVPTPLLDLTHSLRVAVSFAAMSGGQSAYVFALAVPQISGAITASAEEGLQMIRLASVCPPEAVRPHIQEGYLIGEYPDLGDSSQKSLYPTYEIDCAHRLIAKFTFNPQLFEKDPNFPVVPEAALYPLESNDPMLEVADQIRQLLI